MLVVNSRFLTQQITGVQRFAIEISLRLKDMLKDDVIFVSPHGIIHSEISKHLDVQIVGKNKGYVWEQFDLPRYLRRNGSPMLLNLCSMAPYYYPNNIITVHDITFERYPKTFATSFRTFYHFMIPMLCRKAKIVITVSKFSRDEIASFYNLDKEKIIVIYNAVGKSFVSDPDEKLKQNKYYLAVSSVKENKNFATILAAFDRLKVDECRLYIIGDCASNTFKSMNLEPCKMNQRIKILGRVTDEELVKYYSNAIAFIFPSLYEGFGIPTIEAQACGCPVIASDRSALPEILGDSAILCDPFDIENISKSMESLYKDETYRNMLIEKGYQNIKRFAWDTSAMEIVNII